MNAVDSTLITNASSASLGSVQGAASVSVLKKAMNAQASSAAQLIEALPQPALATSGTVGTRVNAVA